MGRALTQQPAGRVALALLRWLAPVSALTFGWITLHHYEVEYTDLAALTAYLLAGITLPGLLVWRGLRGRTDVFYLDAGAGFAVGCALQLLVYLPARWTGYPQAVLVAPALILAMFAVHPHLRRWWRGSPAGSVAGAWVIALSVILAVALLGVGTFRSEPLAGPGSNYLYVDMPFHIALAAELKHHVPFTTPYVTDTPLRYHWYSHAHTAATSWATGVELEVLIRRIIPVSLLMATAVGTAGLAQSWARRTWTGPLAAAILLGTSGITLYGWQPVTASPLLGLPWWASPSQAFGQLMVIPAVALLIDIVRHRRMPRPTVWILFGLSVAAVMAAKATMVPLLAAAACMACGSWLVFRRKLHAPSLICAGIVIGALLFAQFVIFGGATQGTTLKPFEAVSERRGSWGFDVDAGGAWPTVSTATLAFLDLAGYLLLAAALVVFGRRLLTNPGVAALSGVAIAGMGATLVFRQHGGSERYFTRSAIALMIPMAVWGLALLIRRTDRKVGLLLAVAGALGPWIAAWIAGFTTPRPQASTNWEALWFALGPVLAAFAAATAVGLLLALLAKAWGTRLSAGAAALLLVAGMGTLPVYRALAQYSEVVEAEGLDHVVTTSGQPHLPDGGKEAARFLRSNSTPDDLIATNAHCLVPEVRRCDSRAFWVAGWTERRVLLEGWAYTVRANDAEDAASALAGAFWDPELKAENDAVFTRPTPAAAEVLKSKHGVDFLVVDQRFGSVNQKRMAVVADRLYDQGEVQIWRLR